MFDFTKESLFAQSGEFTELNEADLKACVGGTGGAVSNLLENTDVGVDLSSLPVLNKLPQLVSVNAPVTATVTDVVGSLGL